MGMDDTNLLVQCDFEVFGHVQGKASMFWLKVKLITIENDLNIGVGFTKYCRDNCLNGGIHGWVKNSKRGTIVGKMQGRKEEVDKM